MGSRAPPGGWAPLKAATTRPAKVRPKAQRHALTNNRRRAGVQCRISQMQWLIRRICCEILQATSKFTSVHGRMNCLFKKRGQENHAERACKSGLRSFQPCSDRPGTHRRLLLCQSNKEKTLLKQEITDASKPSQRPLKPLVCLLHHPRDNPVLRRSMQRGVGISTVRTDSPAAVWERPWPGIRTGRTNVMPKAVHWEDGFIFRPVPGCQINGAAGCAIGHHRA